MENASFGFVSNPDLISNFTRTGLQKPVPCYTVQIITKHLIFIVTDVVMIIEFNVQKN